MNDGRTESPEEQLAGHILRVRPGHGANCSSIGSVIDGLYAASVLGGAVLAAICAALVREAQASERAPSEGTTSHEDPG